MPDNDIQNAPDNDSRRAFDNDSRNVFDNDSRNVFDNDSRDVRNNSSRDIYNNPPGDALEKDFQHILAQKAPGENLKKASQAIGLLAAYYLFSMIFPDLYMAKKAPRAVVWLLLVIELACLVGAETLAVISFRRTIRSLQTQKVWKNYLALLLSVLLLAVPLFWIIQFLYWHPWTHGRPLW